MRAALAGKKTNDQIPAALKIVAGALVIGLIGTGLWLLVRFASEGGPTPIAPVTSTAVRQTPTSSPTSTAAATVGSSPIPTASPSPSLPLEPIELRPTMTPTQSHNIGDSQLSAADGMIMVYVPAGEFLMGSVSDDPDSDRDESPRHLVSLDGFWIDGTEVTNAMFSHFVADTGYETDAEGKGGSLVWNQDNNKEYLEGANWRHPHGPASTIQGLEHPVSQISWHDAVAYCTWAGRRLQTEAEWEKAARGVNAQRFPWGDRGAAGNLLNFADRNLDVPWADTAVNDGYQYTAPVGSYPNGASTYGALDMAGNVYEWVADWYDQDTYSLSTMVNPQGPQSGDERVLRGGGWVSGEIFTRSAFRNRLSPDDSTDAYGFRCALSDSSADF
jgi:formylglycine-generating enzyme required for sulfatase activity